MPDHRDNEDNDDNADFDELDDRLRGLFDDRRLAVEVRPGAADAVLRGAHRRARRRTVAASAVGALAVGALVFAGAAGFGGHRTALPAAAPGLTTVSPTSAAAGDVLVGVDGVSGPVTLRLGQTVAQVATAGLATAAPSPARSAPAECSVLRAPGLVLTFAQDRLVRIETATGHTGAGVGPGSPVDQVLGAYPQARAQGAAVAPSTGETAPGRSRPVGPPTPVTTSPAASSPAVPPVPPVAPGPTVTSTTRAPVTTQQDQDAVLTVSLGRTAWVFTTRSGTVTALAVTETGSGCG